MGLVQVEVGGDKVALARCVVAGEPRLRRVVATIVAKVPEREVSRQRHLLLKSRDLWNAVHSSEREFEHPSWFIFSLLSL